MPLLDHFHPPLHGSRRWEGFHHAWATVVAQHLNHELPPDYFAEPEINIGPELEIDVATLHLAPSAGQATETATAVWSPPRPKFATKVDFARLDSYEIRVYQDLGGAELRAAIELVSPRNKDRAGSRRTFAAKCAGHLKHGVAVMIVDIVTSRKANLHAELLTTLAVKNRAAEWRSSTGLYAVAYRAVTARKSPRVQVWPEPLRIGGPLPVLPLWIAPDLALPVALEESYQATCQSLRISA
jgi:hypothetical protein